MSWNVYLTDQQANQLLDEIMQLKLTWMSVCTATKSIVASLGVLILLSGCTGTNKVDLLEARLREQEVVVQNYKSEIASVRSQLTIAQRESKILREQLVRGGEKSPAVEATEALASVERLQFSNLLTASQNKDSKPGDERFHAIVIPYDRDGELVKVVGNVEFEAIDLSLPEDQRTIGRWKYTPEEAQKLWHSGFLAAGYRFDLPWERLPQGKEILLHMKLETPDGRELTANHTVKIDPPLQLSMKSKTPDQLKIPKIIQQVKSEKQSAASGEKNRPKSALDTLGTAMDSAGKAELLPISFEKRATPVNEKITPADPRPFPSGLKTSDSWTDATIPVLR